MGMGGDSGVGWVRIGMNRGIRNDGWRGEDGATGMIRLWDGNTN